MNMFIVLLLFTVFPISMTFSMTPITHDCGNIVKIKDQYWCGWKDMMCLQCPRNTFLYGPCKTNAGDSDCRICPPGKYNCYSFHMNATCEDTCDEPLGRKTDRRTVEMIKNKTGTTMAPPDTAEGNKATVPEHSRLFVFLFAIMALIWFRSFLPFMVITIVV